jgi:sulfotransferase famil protein
MSSARVSNASVGVRPPEPDDRSITSRSTLRRNIGRYRIVAGDGLIDRAVIGGAFQALKLAGRLGVLPARTATADLELDPIVSDKYRFAFLGIAKVATKSVGHALLRAADLDAHLIGQRSASAVAQDECYAGYFKFSIVRNPWSRAASCYYDKIRLPNTVNKVTFLAKRPGLSPDMPFDRFIEWLCSEDGADAYADRHWVSQYRIISDSHGRIVCDFIGRLENIGVDFRTICDAIAIPPIEVPHRHKSRYDQALRNYRDLYNDNTRNLIGRRYERDLDAFKYVF